ncbi:MAG: DNA repair protein RadC [Thermoplasmatota archaeon]
MKIKDIPWYNRPGVRLKKKGVNHLSDAELLAIVLGRGNKEENAVDLSNRILGRYNFDKLDDLSLHELEKECKNQVKAMKIIAMFEIFKRTNRLSKKGFSKKIRNAEDVFHYYVDELKDKKKEYFYALFLDTKNKVIAEEEISVGILDASLIHPREVFKSAIKASSNSIILVHNHPSGDCTPSKEDKNVTKILENAGDLLGIRVLDHIIVGSDQYYSFREHDI